MPVFEFPLQLPKETEGVKYLNKIKVTSRLPEGGHFPCTCKTLSKYISQEKYFLMAVLSEMSLP